MTIEIGQVIIQCDYCEERLVHDPSPNYKSSTAYPGWNSSGAIHYAEDDGWSITYNLDIKDYDTACPSCTSSVMGSKSSLRRIKTS